MDKLVSLQEVQALVALFSKCTMSPAEQLWAQVIAKRLFAYANQKPSKPDIDLDIKQPASAQEDDNGNQE